MWIVRDIFNLSLGDVILINRKKKVKIVELKQITSIKMNGLWVQMSIGSEFEVIQEKVIKKENKYVLRYKNNPAMLIEGWYKAKYFDEVKQYD